MNKMRQNFLLVALVITSDAYAGIGDYQIFDLGTMSGATITSVNDNLQMVGYTPGVNNQFMIYDSGAINYIEGFDFSAGQDAMQPLDINNAGQIVGTTLVGDPLEGDIGSYGFIYDAGTLTNMTTITGGSNSSFGINDQGQVVGEYGLGPAGEYIDDNLYVYDTQTGELTDYGVIVPTSEAGEIWDADINNNGLIAGTSFTLGIASDFVFVNGTYQDLGLNGTYLDMNNQDQILTYHPYQGGSGIYQDGTTTPIQASTWYGVKDIESIATAFNDEGVVAGVLNPNDGFYLVDSGIFMLDPNVDPNDPFLEFEGQNIFDLCYLTSCDGSGWESLDSVLDITNNGDIVGQGIIDGETRYFLATPNGAPVIVPLPAAVWLFGSGLLGLFGFSRIGKKQ